MKAKRHLSRVMNSRMWLLIIIDKHISGDVMRSSMESMTKALELHLSGEMR